MNFLLFNNQCGILSPIKKELEKRGHKATIFNYYDTFGYERDIYCNRFNPLYLVYFIYFLLRYDVFLFVSVPGFFVINIRVLDQRLLPVLKFFRKKVLYMVTGSDIRDPEVHQKASKFSYTRRVKMPKAWYEKRERRLRKIFKYADKVLIPNKELMESAKAFLKKTALEEYNDKLVTTVRMPIIIPNKIKQKRNKSLVFLHAPTNRTIKGTEYIIRAVDNLKKAGYDFEFRMIENVPHSEFLKEISNSDVVIDQLGGGGVGGMFCKEGMAFGKPVVLYLIKQFCTEKMPVIEANPENIEKVLEDILKNKYNLRRIGQEAREYIIKYHSPKVVTKELLKIV